MANLILDFIKKSYVVLIILAAAIIFFLGYNRYLLDHSLANLRVALDRVSDVKTMEDAKKLASALDYSLITEVASKKLETSNIARIELAMDILTKPQDMSQLKDVKFALEGVIKQKESQRSVILVALDKISKIFAPAAVKVSKAQLKDQAGYLKERIDTLKDKDQLQEAYYDLANIYTKMSDFTRARETYLKAVDLNPSSKLAQKCRFNLAWNEKQQGNLDQALKEFENLSQTTGEEKLAIFSKYQMADTYRKKGDYEKASVIFQEVARQSSDKELSSFADKELSSFAEFRAGYTYLYDLKDYEKAKGIFDKSKELLKGSSIATHIEDITMPNIVAQYRQEGFRLLREGYELSLPEKYKEAQKYFDKALGIAPDDGLSCIGKALGFLWLNDPDRALDFARKAVKLLPENEVASVNLGYIYLKLGIIDEAIVEYKRFIAVNPFSATGHYNLGFAYAIQNKLEEAVVAFYQATKIDPTFAHAFNNQGWCLWHLSRFGEAVEAFKKTVLVNPRFLDALFNLGMVYREMGRYEESRDMFRNALEISPDYPEALNKLKEVEKIIDQKKAQ